MPRGPKYEKVRKNRVKSQGYYTANQLKKLLFPISHCKSRKFPLGKPGILDVAKNGVFPENRGFWHFLPLFFEVPIEIINITNICRKYGKYAIFQELSISTVNMLKMGNFIKISLFHIFIVLRDFQKIAKILQS